jgi:hypothetical protein
MQKRLQNIGVLVFLFWCAVALYGVMAVAWLLRENSDAVRAWLIGHWMWIAVAAVVVMIERRRETNIWGHGFREGCIYAAEVQSKIDNRQALRLKMQTNSGFSPQ